MLKVAILKIGKLKKEYLEAEQEFLKRLKAFASVEIIEKKDDDAIAKSINKDTYVIALDRLGKKIDSYQLADAIKKERDFGKGAITFVIGGPHGLLEAALKQADLKLSFGPLTFTHQLAYILLLEQLYRAHTILTNKRYHY